jgi:hypothetical protein
MKSRKYDEPEGINSFLFERLETEFSVSVFSYEWTFLCFALNGRSDAEAVLIVLDAFARGSTADRLFTYEEQDSVGCICSSRVFKKRFGFSVRVASPDYSRERSGLVPPRWSSVDVESWTFLT